MSLKFYAHGTPAPQGSKKVFNGHVVEMSAGLKPWRESVKYAALDAAQANGSSTLQGPLSLTIDFFFKRPASHYGTGRNSQVLKQTAPDCKSSAPDLSKLIRATEDALTDAGAWADDRLVVEVSARKRYCPPGRLPGAEVWIEEVGEK